MVTRIKKIWENRNKIISGIWSSWFPNHYIKKIAEKRDSICKSNVCGFFDLKGEHSNCYVKGKPCCSGCGCNEKYKVHSLSSYCYLKDLGLKPLWDSKMTEKEQDTFEIKNKIVNNY